MAKDEKTDGQIESAFSLWGGRGKVSYSGYNQENLVIPKGAKILVFKNTTATPENKRPLLNVCFVVENDKKE